jgi:hypothetical protein
MRESVGQVPTAGEQTQQKPCRTRSDVGSERVKTCSLFVLWKLRRSNQMHIRTSRASGLNPPDNICEWHCVLGPDVWEEYLTVLLAIFLVLVVGAGRHFTLLYWKGICSASLKKIKQPGCLFLPLYVTILTKGFSCFFLSFSPFQSNFSANSLFPSSYLFWVVKRLVDYL